MIVTYKMSKAWPTAMLNKYSSKSNSMYLSVSCQAIKPIIASSDTANRYYSQPHSLIDDHVSEKPCMKPLSVCVN